MKKLSIKMRVTLWFTLFMMLLVVVGSVFLIFTQRKLNSLSLQKKLMETVDEIEDMNRNQLGEKISVPVNDIYISMYGMDGTWLAGIAPDGFESQQTFTKDTSRKMKSGGKEWFVYDVQLKKDHGTYIWIRGILPLHDTVRSEDIFFRLLVLALPFLVLVIAVVGYLVIDRGLRPVQDMIQTAEAIGEAGDLSRRIQLGEGTDEIHTLAKTFNGMFDKLEGYFENEKRFTADASHELRTPASVILAQCDYGLEHASSTEEAKESLLKIRQQAVKMSALIANLLTLARMDNGQYQLENLERINFSELVEIIGEQQNEMAKEKKIDVITEVQPDVFLMADETMMIRMLINLIENAVQYGKENGWVKLSLKRQKDHVELKVADNGIGIAKEHLKHIWERFYQVDPSRSSGRNNTGLGLAMVKWIVSAHKGEITVISQPGEGTVFTVILPFEM
ncbi:sensor histidine kinase [Lacrimispora sp. 38-1]|uniref:sensor histidine kinase n=1 Tax=Lacrimispora sp. 38-1 TaxID=3125778 RepID=UPI003CF85DC4